jgi:hypothetical protein
MNSPKKSQPYGKANPSDDLLDWAKVHLIRGLLGVQSGVREPIVETLKSSIDSTLEECGQSNADLRSFERAAREIVTQIAEVDCLDSSFGFTELDLRDSEWTPLFIHHQLITHLRKVAGYQNILIVIRGLKTCYQDNKKNFTQERYRGYQQLRDDLDSIIAKWSPRYGTMHVIYL